MAAKQSLLILSLLIVYACAQISLEDVIRQVFNKESSLVETTTQKFEIKSIKTTHSNPKSSEITKTYKSCGTDKECVPRHLCDNGVISGENLININTHDNGCNYSEVCCDISNKTSKPVIAAIPKERHEGCGWRNIYGIGFRIAIDDDTETQFAEFPWMVAILRKEYVGAETIHVYECGGSLIAPNVVLTAAHCVYNRNIDNMIVRGGEWDTQNNNEILNHVDKSVMEIITHENYNNATLYNSVALLILKESFDYQENIRPVCLPSPHDNFDLSHCYVTSWGKNKLDGEYQVILKKIELPVVSHDTCQNKLRQTRLGLYFNLHESFLCAGGQKGKDTCTGAGGSPLVCPMSVGKNRYYQTGIVAWGIGCADDNIPGVYVNVKYFQPWILEKLNAKNIKYSHFMP